MKQFITSIMLFFSVLSSANDNLLSMNFDNFVQGVQQGADWQTKYDNDREDRTELLKRREEAYNAELARKKVAEDMAAYEQNKYNEKIENYRYLTKICDEGDAAGCTNLADLYANGDGIKKNKFKAVELYTKGCNMGDALGCSNLGIFYFSGDSVRQDYIKAVEFFKKGCDGGNQMGCMGLGMAYSKGQGIKQDKRKAKELFGKACDLKFEFGCENYKMINEEGY